MANARRVAMATLIVGFLSSCGGDAAQSPTLAVTPVARTTYFGSTGVSVNARTSSTDEISWSLDGPGTISQPTGTATTYTPPGTGDAETAATLTATAGELRASTTFTILPEPFTLSPPSLVVTAGGGMARVLVVLRDPTRQFGWWYSLQGPGGVDDWYAPPQVMYFPPESATIATSATLEVSAIDYPPFARAVPITILPGP